MLNFKTFATHDINFVVYKGVKYLNSGNSGFILFDRNQLNSNRIDDILLHFIEHQSIKIYFFKASNLRTVIDLTPSQLLLNVIEEINNASIALSD